MTTKKQEQEIVPKQYIGISRDHSGSMSLLTKAASNDYNDNIATIKEAATENGIDTIVSVVKCGVGWRGAVEREVVNSNVNILRPLTSYKANGGSTPLFDSVGELIELLEAAPDANEKHVSFLIMAITDGQENSSTKWNGTKLGKKIRELQATDRWTFVFRVPEGYATSLQKLGIPAGNILEWQQTQRGMEQSSAATVSAFKNYYAARKSGAKSSDTFYVNLTKVAAKTVRQECHDITKEILMWDVRDTSEIKAFVEKKLGHSMQLGCAFYQLTKPEKAVQDYKLICIRNKKSGTIYGGEEARTLLGLPTVGTVKLVPGNFGEFDVFIQSTSTNRKLIAGTKLLYWPSPKM